MLACPRLPALLALFVVLVAGACDCTSSPKGPPDGGGDDAGQDAGPLPDAGCTAAAPQCGSTCCGGGSFCDSNQVCCPYASACGDRCCGANETCEGAVCHESCGGDASLRCADPSGHEICCEAGQVCATGTCFTPTTSCVDFIDCPDGQYCEPSVQGGRCLPQPGGPTCQQTPMGTAVIPTSLWQWPASAGGGAIEAPTSTQVMMTPLVANLTDDNGDGSIDENDVPDVVFTSYVGSTYTTGGTLRALHGEDGTAIFSVTTGMHHLSGGGQLAIGNIDDDPEPEIVGCKAEGSSPGPLIAFEHTGAFKWEASDPRAVCGQAGPSIADLDGDGDVEVFVRYTVVRGADGSFVDAEVCDGIGNLGSTIRNSHDPCDYTTAANVDADPALEIVGGNVAFDYADPAGLTPVWDFRDCTGVNCRNDGYPAVADFDRDGTPEIAVVESGWLWGDTMPAGEAYQGDHYLVIRDAATGVVEAGPIDINLVTPPMGDTTSCTTVDGTSYCKVGGGGPPTIGNFDPADADPEVALAGAYNYVVFDVDLQNATASERLKELWHRRTNDDSSRKTGSSIFDFNGDGAAEVVYNDQQWLRVYDGATGVTQFCRCNTSATLWEYPVVADVDNDGHADIVVASNTNDADTTTGTCSEVPGDQCTADEIAAGHGTSTAGVRVIKGPGEGWIGTRRIWNQHTYHVTNVTESGQVPPVETRNWTIGALNNFRLNVQPGATNQPDLRPRNVSVDVSACYATMRIYVEIYNAGWSSSPTGIPVAFYGGARGALDFLGTVSTAHPILPGQYELLSLEYPIDFPDRLEAHGFEVIVNDPAHSPTSSLMECQAGNNTAATSATCFPNLEN